MKITNKMRFMLIMLSVLMVLSLFACAETPEETTTKAPVETTEKPTETTEKTEPTEAPVDTDATDAPVVDDTTDADVAETTETETETESETESESASETATESATTETIEVETTEVETTEVETTETETTEAPACDHAETEVDAAVAPTCEETGLTEGSHCALCGAVVVAQDVVPAKGHAYEDVVTTEPTCEGKGVKTFTCANDATHTYTEEIPAKGHAWDNGVVTTEATCEAKGVKTFTCANDATHTKTEDVDPTGHAWDNGVVTAEPTCEGKGVKTFTCANDATHTKTEEIPANGHGEGVKDVEDNCNVKCPVCQKVLAEGQHDPAKKAAAWTHVIGAPDENGKLYEALLCGDCGKPAETRELYYINCCDSVYVDGVVVNPGANPKQTTGFGMKYSDCSVIDGENFIAANGEKIFVSDELKFSGWLVMNGGVKSYGVFIDDGEGEPTWYPMTGAANINNANGIYTSIIAVNDEITDKEGAKTLCGYQTKMSVPGLANYAGKTVTITFGAIPAGNPGEDGAPNIVTLAKLTNVEINGVEKIGTTSKAIAPFTATVAEGDADGVTYYWNAVVPGDLILTFPTVEGVSYSYKVFTNANPGVVYTEEDAVDGKLTVKVAKDHRIFIQIVTDEAKALEAEIGLAVDCYAYGADVPVQAISGTLNQTRDAEGNLVITATSVASNTDANFTLFSDRDIAVTGRYIILTYKTTNTNFNQVHLQGDKADGTDISWKDFGSIKTVKDGEWHTAVIDVYAALGSNTTTCVFRLDTCEYNVGESITIKGFEFVDDLAAANRELGGPLWSYSGEDITASGMQCLTDDADGDGETDRDADGNLILSSAKKGDAYATILSGACTARYIAITVKASDSDSILGSIFVTPRGENINTKYTTGAPVVDHIGEWVTVIIDVRNYVQSQTAKDNDAIKALRIDCCDNGGTMTIKSIEGFGDLDMAVASAGENVVLGVGVTLPTQE